MIIYGILYLLLIYFIWIGYACQEGYNEAIYWSKLINNNGTPSNEHLKWTIWRSITLILGFISTFSILSIWLSLLFALSLILIFPFWHDGFYYLKRNKLDNCYPKGFRDFSKTSTSWLDKLKLTIFPLRVFYLILSLIMLLYIFIN